LVRNATTNELLTINKKNSTNIDQSQVLAIWQLYNFERVLPLPDYGGESQPDPGPEDTAGERHKHEHATAKAGWIALLN